MEEENNKKEINNLKNPIDSPGNIFKSPNDRQQENPVMVDKIWGRNDGLAKSDIRVFDPYLKRQSIDPKNQKYYQIDPKI